jgi:hypothetical protein
MPLILGAIFFVWAGLIVGLLIVIGGLLVLALDDSGIPG